jgi:4-phospho-D-threonate 3-dehydrogenase / 4-phospho-D-erythronate 3-dehydrogenase
MNKIVAITIGDAGGIGPEVSVKTALDLDVVAVCQPILVGPQSVIQRACDLYAPKIILKKWQGKPEVGVLFYEDFDQLKLGSYPDSKSSAEAGLVAYDGVKKTTEAVRDGLFDAIVTAPVSKESVNLAGISFQGHTELVAEVCGIENFCMMQSDADLRVVFVTCHIALNKVTEALSQERILDTIKLLDDAVKADGIQNPLLAIAGVNPHAGECGYMGREEIDMVIPAMEEAKKFGINVAGPFPADTLFIESIRKKFDGIVCMYHDQGHIPFKMLAFDRGVNSTLGLPIIRTSVDHGTAFNIAWKGIADTGSLKAAILTAVRRIERKIQKV